MLYMQFMKENVDYAYHTHINRYIELNFQHVQLTLLRILETVRTFVLYYQCPFGFNLLSDIVMS